MSTKTSVISWDNSKPVLLTCPMPINSWPLSTNNELKPPNHWLSISNKKFQISKASLLKLESKILNSTKNSICKKISLITETVKLPNAKWKSMDTPFLRISWVPRAKVFSMKLKLLELILPGMSRPRTKCIAKMPTKKRNSPIWPLK